VAKKLLLFAGPCGQTMQVSSKHLGDLPEKCSINMGISVATGGTEFPTATPSSCSYNLSSLWKYVVVKQMSSNSITSSTCKCESSGKEGSVLSLFLMSCEVSSFGMLENRLITNLQGSLRFDC
jgi:hypothetical protein